MADASRSCLPTSFLRTYISHFNESNRVRAKFPRPGTGEQRYLGEWHRITEESDLTRLLLA